jgi:phage terminase large subunit-like protein
MNEKLPEQLAAYLGSARDPGYAGRARELQSAIQAEDCARSLHIYVCSAWHLVEPRTPFVDNWHIGLICEYLQAVTELEIHNLIINVPPRHMKSLLVSVFWPTWSWITAPHLRWLTGSYAIPLAVRDALKSRRILQSRWYQQRFGGSFSLCGDQNLKGRYENDRSGYRLAFSFNSAVTGEGADVLVVDDPLKAQDADNPQQRERVNEIYDQTLSTRANDPRAARRVIIMQRLHEDDLSGHLLEKMQMDGAPAYQHLCLPTEYAPRLFIPFHGHSDPRGTPGELLWPARFGAKENAAARLDLGQRGYAGQHDQRPAPDGGNIYQAGWWQAHNRYDLRCQDLSVIARWISWDTALKDQEQHDSSALTVWELLGDYRIRLRYAGWHKLQFPQLASAIQAEARAWMADGKLRGILIEDKASGISALQTLEQSAAPEIAGLLRPFQPGQLSKTARARQASLWCERGCVLLPEPSDELPWLYEFEDMLYKFPAAKLNDPADSLSQAILYLENILAEGWRARLARI